MHVEPYWWPILAISAAISESVSLNPTVPTSPLPSSLPPLSSNCTHFAPLVSHTHMTQVKLNWGSRLLKLQNIYSPENVNFSKEYSHKECAVEVVDSMEDAVGHINTFGSGHTDTIVTSSGQCV